MRELASTLARRWGARLAVGSLAIGSLGCVYPATDPTGVELSWRFVEHNEADGEDGAAIRTCAGAQTETIAVDIDDQDDPTRHGGFRFDCGAGYQTAIELQTAASDAFVRLDPGTYTLVMSAFDRADDATDEEIVAVREVDVDARGITVQTWTLRRAPVTWRLTVMGVEDCEALSMALRYATPEDDLSDYAPLPEDTELPLYRRGLRSHRGLDLGGDAIACSAELGGEHRFDDVDRGEYRLQIEHDGQRCDVLVDLSGPDDPSSVIDLANLPCEG